MNVTPQNNEDIIEGNDFSYDGFQVVRGEFFAHIYEPSFTLNNYKCRGKYCLYQKASGL